jgi:diguanylate cyclase (GGDEF)-like protein
MDTERGGADPALATSTLSVVAVQKATSGHAWAVLLTVVTGYACAIFVGSMLRDELSGVSLFWLPNCVLVSAMIFTPGRLWPIVMAGGLIGELIGDSLTGVAVGFALLLGSLNVVEAAAVAYLCRRMDRDEWPLSTVRSVVVVTASITGVAAVTAIPGGLVAARAFGGDLPRSYLSWWLGDSLGMLVGVPLLVMAIGLLAVRSPSQLRQAGVLVVAGIAITAVDIELGRVSASASAGFVVIAVANAMAMWAGTNGAAVGSVMLASVAVVSLNPQDPAGRIAAQLFAIPVVVALLLMGAQVVTMRRQQAALTAAQSRIEALAITDGLTGLLNFRGLAMRGALELARARRNGGSLGVMYGDVDGLKGINDSLGHAVGSQALIEIAKVLRSSCRATDLVARIGGDEFAVMLPARDRAEVEGVRKRLEAKMAEASALSADLGYRLSMSLGVIFVEPADLAEATDEELLEVLLRRADKLMYQQKATR